MTNPSPNNIDSLWIDDLLNAAINFKQASVDFAAEAELFGDNEAVLATANTRLEQLKAKAREEIQKKLTEARIDELQDMLFKAREHTITDIEMIQHHTQGKIDFIEAVTTDLITNRLAQLQNRNDV